MEGFGISISITPEELKQSLKAVFPDLSFYHWKPDENSVEDNQSLLFTINYTNSEFPIKVDIYGFSGEFTAEREQFIAKQLSIILNCRTIIPFQLKADPSNPFFAVIFDTGISYLADDNETIWADGEGSAVKVISQIQLVSEQFDSRGRLSRYSK